MTGNGSKEMRMYDLRDPDGHWLGRVIIADDGYFSTVGEYGNYAYWWGSAGDCFRRFLTEINTDYLLSKIAPEALDSYDAGATLKDVCKCICQMRRGGDLTKAEARAEWDRLEYFDGLYSDGAFSAWLGETEIPDAHELRRTRIAPDAAGFASKVWPALVSALRAELERQAA